VGRIAEKEGFKSEMKVRVGNNNKFTAHIVLCKLYFTLDGPVRSCPLQNSLR